MISKAFVGPAWMVGSGAGLTAIAVCIRMVSGHIDPIEIVFFRNFFALAFMLPMLIRSGLSMLKTDRIGLHMMRALSGLAAMSCWFTAVTMMPIAELTALSFLAPLFTTAGAALLLGESVGVRRWTATLVGFAGAMLIIRPGFQELTLGPILGLTASVIFASSMLMVKKLSDTEPPSRIVLYQNLFLMPASAIPALFVWTWPVGDAWIWLAAVGFFAVVGHITMARAFAVADASAVMPYDYSRLIFAALFGFFIFAEIPDGFTWAGSVIIFAAALYVTRREVKVNPKPENG